MHLTPEQIKWLQEAYRDQTNFGSDDLLSPIDPETYQWPEGERLIHIAALRGDLKSVEMLVSAGENVNAIADMGSTPAHYAAAQQHKDVFDFLMAHGADATIVNEFGQTPPQLWVFYEQEKG